MATLREIFNVCFNDTWDYYPITQEEFDEEMKPLQSSGDPNQMLIAEVDGTVAGVCLGVPDPSQSRVVIRGGFAAIRRRLSRTSGPPGFPTTLAVLPGYRGMHVGHTLLAGLLMYYRKLGAYDIEAPYVNAANTPMVSLMESFAGEGTVRYHNFEKPIKR
jgi:GNAT superfamily N-acetyltransferase